MNQHTPCSSAALAAEIRSRLAYHNMSRAELAAALKVERSWVYRRLNGTTPLSVDDLGRIGQALDLSIVATSAGIAVTA